MSGKVNMKIDLNCDLGESAGNDEVIMPYSTSAKAISSLRSGRLLRTVRSQ